METSTLRGEDMGGVGRGGDGRDGEEEEMGGMGKRMRWEGWGRGGDGRDGEEEMGGMGKRRRWEEWGRGGDGRNGEEEEMRRSKFADSPLTHIPVILLKHSGYCCRVKTSYALTSQQVQSNSSSCFHK